ncbi:MAG: hypothetical protein A2046_12095 [Bacteroidetes bacterium GWA2_30_7]|nr:MAG: hypothetical protein A2046_12095 [Bacteroidetes bacterium GWA2_30_7]
MKSIILALSLLIITSSIKSQNYDLNNKKYWLYRERLQYFVVNDKPEFEGVGCVASERNSWGTQTIAYGQHIINFGYYLGVLASEYALLKKQGINADSTENELENALKSYIRLDKCEKSERWGMSENKFDGFFMREDVPYNFLEKYSEKLNFGLDKKSTVYNTKFGVGYPAYVDEIYSYDKRCKIYVSRDTWNPKAGIISQDEAIGLLMGLAIVKKLMPDSSYSCKTAKLITKTLITHIRNNDESLGSKHWMIYNPHGELVDYNLGGDARAYSYGFAKAAEFITDEPIDSFYSGYEKRRAYKSLWNTFQFYGVSNTHAHLVAALAAVGNSWSIAGKNNTGKGILNVTIKEKWHPLYLLIWKTLQNSKDEYFINDVIIDLNSAPEFGPYCLNDSIKSNFGGWASSAKYWHTKEEQFDGTPDWFSGLYNGLDYLLLYNLYHLSVIESEKKPKGFPEYNKFRK